MQPCVFPVVSRRECVVMDGGEIAFQFFEYLNLYGSGAGTAKVNAIAYPRAAAGTGVFISAAATEAFTAFCGFGGFSHIIFALRFARRGVLDAGLDGWWGI